MRRRIFLSIGIAFAVVLAIVAMTAGNPVATESAAPVAAVTSAPAPSPSATNTIEASPPYCEERTAYTWNISPTEPVKSVRQLLTKGKQASFTQSVTITRSIKSVSVWCEADRGLEQCGTDDTPDCPAGIEPIKTSDDEMAELSSKTTCTSGKGFTCTPGSAEPQMLRGDHVVVTHAVKLKNESSRCKTSASFSTVFKVVTPSEPTAVTWSSPKTTVDSGTCPKPVVKPKPKPKPKPVVRKAPKPTVTWVKMTASHWRSNPSLISRYLTVCLGTEPAGHQDYEPTCIGTTSYAQSVLSGSNSGNGLTRLSAQLLTAKLNIKSGAAAGNAGCLGEADRLLDYYKHSEWSLLSDYNKSYVRGCADRLSYFNSSVVRRS